MKICPKCGWENDDDFNFCLGCGYQLPSGPGEKEQKPAVEEKTSSGSDENSPAKLVLLLPNGQEGGTYPLKPDKTLIGRKQGNILFLDDPYVSPLHATFSRTSNGGLQVRDEDSRNGLFLRLRERVKLQNKDVVLLGKQLLSFEELKEPAALPPKELNPKKPDPTPKWGSPQTSYWGRLVQLIAGGRQGNSVLLGGTQIDLGRERGQLTFPGDRFISGIHARISRENGSFYAEDLGSRNGTFVRIRGERILQDKDVLIIGEQLLRVDFNN